MPPQSRRPCRSEDDVSSSWSRPPNFLFRARPPPCNNDICRNAIFRWDNESHTHLMPTYRPSADNRSGGGSAPASVCGAANVAILKRDGNQARFDHPPSAQRFVLFSLIRIPVSHLWGLLCSFNPSGLYDRKTPKSTSTARDAIYHRIYRVANPRRPLFAEPSVQLISRFSVPADASPRSTVSSSASCCSAHPSARQVACGIRNDTSKPPDAIAYRVPIGQCSGRPATDAICGKPSATCVCFPQVGAANITESFR